MTTDPAPSTDPSDQDTKSGKCTSNDINCYLKGDYWKDMDAIAEGPLVKVLESLPPDLKSLFESEYEASVSEASGLEWTKVNEADFDTSKYVALDNTDLESAIVKLAATNPDKITFTEEYFKNITLEDEITDKSLVILDNGHMYLPKVTVSDRTASVVSVMDVAAFVVISVLLVLLLFMVVAKAFRKREKKPTLPGMMP